MTPSISCLYMSFNRDPANITFIKFDNFIKVIFNRRSIIMTIKQFVVNRELFQLYVISLLFTKDTSKIYKDIINDCVYYGVVTLSYCKNFHLANNYKMIYLEKSHHRNPLNSKEPKRASSSKKYNKFMKYFYNCSADEAYIIDPTHMFCDYYCSETTEAIEYFDNYMHEMLAGSEEFMDI